MSKRTMETSARKRPQMSRDNRGWLEEDQDGMRIGSNAKGWLVEDRNQTVSTATTVEPTIEPPSPKIFKLDIDCFDEIFEYLSLNDLHSLGQTCKTMLKVTGEYFKRNYPDATLQMERYRPYVYISGDYTSLPRFNQLFSKIHFEAYNQKPLQYVESHINEFEGTRCLEQVEHQVNERVANAIGSIFPKLETVRLVFVIVRKNLYDIMLKKCENLKSLHLDGLTYEFEHRQEIPGPWIKQKYPKLEHLELTPIPSIDGLNEFFENNPNVCSFSTDAESIWSNNDVILTFKAQLDLLVITNFDDIQRLDCMAPFCRLLSKLYEQGFYKCLHIAMDKIVSTVGAIGLTSLKGLESLTIYFFDEGMFPVLPNLKALEIYIAKIMKLMIEPVKYMNLARLSIVGAEYVDILPLIQQLPNLKTLRLRYSCYTRYSEHEHKILPLKKLNEERGKLIRPRKLTIYVPKEMFLKTKWNVKHGNVNLPLIEMKRIGTCKWNDYES